MERLKLQTEFSDDLSGAWVGRGEAVDRKLSWKSLRAEDRNEVRGHGDGEGRSPLTHIPGAAPAHPELWGIGDELFPTPRFRGRTAADT